MNNKNVKFSVKKKFPSVAAAGVCWRSHLLLLLLLFPVNEVESRVKSNVESVESWMVEGRIGKFFSKKKSSNRE